MNQHLKTIEINLKRTIDANPDEVFEAWLDHTSTLGLRQYPLCE